MNTKAIPNEADCELRPEHVGMLEPIHRLLSALNDPYAGSATIAELIADIPVLSARCMRRARLKALRKEVDSLEQVLGLIGNRGLEAELLVLLEELTVLRAEIEA